MLSVFIFIVFHRELLRLVCSLLFKATNNDNSIFTQNDTKHSIQNGNVEWKSGKWIACHKICHSVLITAQETSEEKHISPWTFMSYYNFKTPLRCVSLLYLTHWYRHENDINRNSMNVKCAPTSANRVHHHQQQQHYQWVDDDESDMAMKSSLVFFLIKDAVVVRRTTGTAYT